MLRRLYPYLPALQSQPQSYLAAFFRTGLDEAHDPLFSQIPRWRMTSGLRALFLGDLRRTLDGYDAVDELRANLPAEFPSWHAQYLEAAYLLPGYILSSQGDRVAMAHAVEGRFPFLDHRAAELAAAVPPRASAAPTCHLKSWTAGPVRWVSPSRTPRRTW